MEKRRFGISSWAMIVLACCLFGTLGCKSPREKYEQAARANLALLPGLEEVARTAPPTDAASSKALASVTGFKLHYMDSNALLIHLEELGNPTLRRELPMRLNHRLPTVDLAEALKLVKPEPGTKLDTTYNPGLNTESNMNSVWQCMGELTFVLVVRTRELQEAELAGNKKFFTGSWKGEVLVFELAGKKLLGGFPIEGTNHGNVKTTSGRDRENLAADLMLATRGNLVSKIRELIPGVASGDEPN